jgi:hypothetical protein
MRGGKRSGAGRKKGFAALEAENARQLIAEKLSTKLGPIIETAIKQAVRGDKHAREWLIERAYGKVLKLEGKFSYSPPRTILSEKRLTQIAQQVLKRKTENP